MGLREDKAALVRFWQRTGTVKDENIIKAFEKVPRENFVSPGYELEAYRDYPLPIGHGQTISQPTTIMVMTKYLDVRSGQNILEVGTGSGYQAALLGNLAGDNGSVYTIEIIGKLADKARRNIESVGLRNVHVIESDGSMGYEKAAPYDRIIVTAACPSIPETLAEQLKEGGIIIAPVGEISFGQDLLKATKINGKLESVNLGKFTFVPLKGRHGFIDED